MITPAVDLSLAIRYSPKKADLAEIRSGERGYLRGLEGKISRGLPYIYGFRRAARGLAPYAP